MTRPNIRNRTGILLRIGEDKQLQARPIEDHWRVVAETFVPNPQAAISVNKRHIHFDGAINIGRGESFRLLAFLTSQGLDAYYDKLVEEINAKMLERQQAAVVREKNLG